MSTAVLLQAPQRWSRRDLLAGQAVVGCVAALAFVTALDVLSDGRLGAPFDVGFVLVCMTAPVAVRTDQLFAVAIAPPLLLALTIWVLAAFWPQSIAMSAVPQSTGVLGHTVAKVVDLGVVLLIAHGLALAATVMRILTDADG